MRILNKLTFQLTNMEELNINSKFKLISTNINSIPPYDGNRDALINFLERIDSMTPILNSFTQDYTVLLLGNIKDKIIGNARRSILINGNPDTWPLIKQVLIDNHGEKNSVDELIDKIRVCRCDSTIENFYNALNTLLCRLNNALYFSGNTFPEVTSESNARIALNSFKYGLPEPVKSIIVSRNPKSLKEAFDITKSNGYLNHRNRPFSFNRNQYNRNSSEQRENNNLNSTYQQPRQNNNNSTLNNRQHIQYSTPINSSMQSRHTSNSSNFTNRRQISSSRINNNNNQRYNVNQNQSQLHNNDLPEPMEVGVNENGENFPLVGRENYPI